MTLIATRTPEGLVLGTPPASAARTALVEIAGALLLWDGADPAAFPAAIVWDPLRALDGAWQLYGPEVSAVLTGDVDVFDPVRGPCADAARRAALAGWAAAWWPASTLADIPPLDARILALERAAALTAIEHLLDDDAAVRAALADGAAAARALRSSAWPAGLRVPLDALSEQVESAAEDRAVSVQEAPVMARTAGYALAAGPVAGNSAGEELAAGSAPLDLSAFPAGTVDAAANVQWSMRRATGGLVLEMTVARAPQVPALADPPAPLVATFAGVPLTLDPEATRFAGRVAVPATILLTRPELRVPTVTSRGYQGTADVDAEALLTAARDRLDRAAASTPGDPAFLLAEHEAARRR